MKNYSELILSKTIIKPFSILEVGSRDAHDSNFLKEFFSIRDENVYVVEPNPNQQTFIKNTYPKFNLISCAIFNECKTLKFNAVLDQELIGISSLLDREDNIYANIKANTINVECITGKQLLESINDEIDLCKIDVEGATYEVLESFGESIKLIKSMHIECEHKQIWTNQKLYDDVKHLLTSRGYKEIYFKYIATETIQSDSIWVLNDLCLK